MKLGQKDVKDADHDEGLAVATGLQGSYRIAG